MTHKSSSNRITALILSVLFVLTTVMQLSPFTVSAYDPGTVAVIDDDEYPSLEDAVSAASSGDTIILVDSVTISSEIDIDKSITLTTNGSAKMVSRDTTSSVFHIESGAALTIKGSNQGNLIFDGHSGDITALSAFFDVEGTLIQRTGTIIRNNNSSGSSGGAVYVNGGEYYINGGSVNSNGSKNGAIYVGSGNLYLFGGSISGNRSSSGRGNGIHVSSSYDSFEISGSPFLGSSDDIYLAKGVYFKISDSLSGSGRITVNLEEPSVGTRIGYVSDKDYINNDQISRFKIAVGSEEYGASLDGSDIIVSNGDDPVTAYPCRIGTNYYSSVAAAVASVSSGDTATVTMIGNTPVSQQININANKTIIIESESTNTIYRSTSYDSGFLFNVASGSKLTIGDGVTVSGSLVEATQGSLGVYGTLVLDKGSVISAAVNKNSNSFHGGAVTVYSGGSLVISGSTIKGNDCSTGAVTLSGGTLNFTNGTVTSNKGVRGGGVYMENGSKMVQTGGEISGNSASYGGGIYLSAGTTLEMSGGILMENSADRGASIYNGGDTVISGSANIAAKEGSSDNDVLLTSGNVLSVVTGWNPHVMSGYTTVINLNVTAGTTGTKVVRFVDSSGNESTAVPTAFKLVGSLAEKNSLAAEGAYVVLFGTSADNLPFEAMIGNETFRSLAEAFEAASTRSSATITLIKDISIASTITVPNGADITLTDGKYGDSANDYTFRTIWRAPGNASAMFSVEMGGKLTVQGKEGKGISINASGVSANSAAFNVVGELTLGEYVTLQHNSNTDTENQTTPGGGVYVNNGILNISGASITECNSSYGGAVYNIDGIVNMTSGYIYKNSASNGAGIAVFTSNNQTNAAPDLPIGTVNISGGAISTNACAASGHGGGIYVANGTAANISGGIIEKNTATYGGAICVGELRTADQKTKSPALNISGSASISNTNLIYLMLPDESFINVVGELTALTPENFIMIDLGTIGQNTALVKYSIPNVEPVVNRSLAANAIDKNLFRLSDTLKNYYTVKAATGDKTMLITSIPDTFDFSGFTNGRIFDGLPVYQVVPVSENVDGSETDENGVPVYNYSPGEPSPADQSSDNNNSEKSGESDVKTADSDSVKYIKLKNLHEQTNGTLVPIEYPHLYVEPETSFTAEYSLTYYTNFYKSVTRSLTGRFPVGTSITFADLSTEDHPGYYYYIVTGSEEIIPEELPLTSETEKTETTDNTNDSTAEAEEEKKLPQPPEIIIPLASFKKMGSEDEYYAFAGSGEDDPSITALTHEHFIFVYDLGTAKIPTDENGDEIYAIEGDFVFSLNHYYDSGIEGVQYDFSSNASKVNFTIAEDGSILELQKKTDSDNSIIVNYIRANNRSSLNGGAVLLIRSDDDSFPKGTVFTCQGKQYPVSQKTPYVSIPISLPDDYSSNTYDISISNYFGSAVSELIRAEIYPSSDRSHPTYGCAEVITSEGIRISVPEKIRYSVKVTEIGSKSDKRPYFEYNDLKDAESIGLNVVGLEGTVNAGYFDMSLEYKKGDEYIATQLSDLFPDYMGMPNPVKQKCGDVILKLGLSVNLSAKYYRLKIAVGDSVEYINLTVK